MMIKDKDIQYVGDEYDESIMRLTSFAAVDIGNNMQNWNLTNLENLF